LANESKKYFRNALGEFIGYLIYARWIPEEDRRETWIETVRRYVDFMKENLGAKLSEEDYEELYKAILNQYVLPSMRLLWSAGAAARATNVAAYNCSYIAITKIRDFGEILHISMCGTGVGFSVEEINACLQPNSSTSKRNCLRISIARCWYCFSCIISKLLFRREFA